jgi:hypothetical protein
VVFRLGFGVVEAVLIVNGAPVNEGQGAVEEEGLRGGGGAECWEESLAGIPDHGGLESVFLEESAFGFWIGVGGDVEEQRKDALRGALLLHSGEFGAEFVTEGAGGLEQGDEQGLALCEGVQGDLDSCGGFQGEVLHPPADAEFVWGKEEGLGG